MNAIINAKIYTGAKVIEQGYIVYTQKIIDIGRMENYTYSCENVINANGKIIIPGMIDIHIHGGYTIDTMDANVKKMVDLSENLLKEGVTSFMPTTMTQSNESISSALEATAKASDVGANIVGIHLEGPFVNVDKAGAQPVQYIKNPDNLLFEQWFELSNKKIKLVTFAPEKDENQDFQLLLEKLNIVGSSGHTDATFSELDERGIKHFTHLFNQMKGLHHREPGTVGYALLSEVGNVEIIPDGIHIHPEMIRLAYKIKGAEHICIITDAMRAKGLPDGDYELGSQPVRLNGNEVRLSDGTLAGSVLKMDHAFRNVISYTGCSIEEAVLMTSINQAKEFNLINKGVLEAQKDSDFVLLNNDLHIVSTFTKGREVKLL